MWRTRWYLYAILLYVKEYIKIDLGFEYIMGDGELNDGTKERLRNEWKDIKKHVELSKMYKFSK